MASPSAEPRSAVFTRVFIYALMDFVTFGFVAGILHVVVTDLLVAFDNTLGAPGRAFTVGSVGSLPDIFYGGRSQPFRSKGTLTAGGMASATALVGTSLADGYGVLVLLLLLSVFASGALDMRIKAAAITAEQRSGRKLSYYCHAAFSGLAALGALLARLSLSSGVSFRLLYLLAALVCILCIVTILLGGGLPREVPAEIASERVSRPRSLFREPVLLLLGGVVALTTVSKSSWKCGRLSTCGKS